MNLQIVKSNVKVVFCLLTLFITGCGEKEFQIQNSALLSGKEFATGDISPMYTTNWFVVSNFQAGPLYMVTVTNTRAEAAQGFSVRALETGTMVRFTVVEYKLSVPASRTFAHFVEPTQ